MSVRRVNLALQGGGAHGAFTWGVLDCLLQRPEIEIAAISGTSAGALNGAALKAGMVVGGREGARENLDWLWHKIGAVRDLRLAGWISALAPGSDILRKAMEYSLPLSFANVASQVISPYSYGPFYQNPMEKIVSDLRFDAICAPEGPALFVGATNVRSGRVKVFQGAEIGPQAILASTCLPTLFKAVEIDGEAYWDGGYTGNPALFPLFDAALPADIVVVNINPLHRADLPYSAQDITNRINEISFNSSLLRELRAIHYVRSLVADKQLPEGMLKGVLVHMIADDALMGDLGVATKVVPSPVILDRLKQAGIAAAEAFLECHMDDLGQRGTLDFDEMFG